MESVRVNLGADSYDVKIGSQILKQSLDAILTDYREENIFIVTNSTINAIYPTTIEDNLPKRFRVHRFILPDGEKYKNLEHIQRIYDFLIEKQANRKSIVIAFGGGVIGDMVGFTAATFMRGIKFIQIPTTLLSQVDSSVGGKTGVNHPLAKNSIGAFYQPIKTIIDVNFLDTLPLREFVAGYSELIKHGFIRDIDLFDQLSTQNIQSLINNKELLIQSIFSSCSVKARVVEEDEKETQIRAILNFGHTLGHFLETFTNYDTYLHGEAVIAGMDFAAWWSEKYGYLSTECRKQVYQHLSNLKVKIKLPVVEKERFIEIISHDKKASKNGITVVALKEIGSAQLCPEISALSLWDDFSAYLQEEENLIQINAE
ncbi:MAG: 3-dehydroquinate synthase [bacterium]|jgi:3-dehydroquinate synthase